MEKKINATGPNGKMEGRIVIYMNFSTEEYNYNNPSTHDSEIKRRNVHKVEAWANDKLWKKSDPINTEQEVEKAARNLESLLGKYLQELASNQPQESFADRMKKLGYN